MAVYECNQCGMSVKTSCGQCDAPLVDGNLVLEDGSSVKIAKCPNDHGMIKSPLCCGNDMSCSV